MAEIQRDNSAREAAATNVQIESINLWKLVSLRIT